MKRFSQIFAVFLAVALLSGCMNVYVRWPTTER